MKELIPYDLLVFFIQSSFYVPSLQFSFHCVTTFCPGFNLLFCIDLCIIFLTHQSRIDIDNSVHMMMYVCI